MADDPYLASGRKVLSGGDDTSSSSTTDDPYLASGRKVLTATPASSNADTKMAQAGTPYDVEHSWLQIPAIHNFAAGVTQSARDVVAGGLQLGAYVDKRMPALAWLDQINPLIGDPEKRAAEFDATRRAYEASPEGQSYTGEAGRVVGGIGMTLPLAGPIGEAAAAGTRLAATAVGRVAPVLGRIITGAGDLISGTAAVPEAGIVPNALTRGTSLALQGGVQGAEYGALTSGGSDRPIGENMLSAAELGMLLSPATAGAAGIVGATGRGARGAFNWATGRGAAQQVDEAIAAARARAGEAGGAEVPPTGGAPAAPQPGGAMATSQAQLEAAAARQTADEAAAQRARNFDLAMNETPRPGDYTEHVEGSHPTTAEALMDPHLAGIQRNVLAGDQRYTNWDAENTEARQVHWERKAGDAVSLDNLERARAAQAEADQAASWGNKRPTTAEPVEAHIHSELASGSGKLAPVEDALQTVERRLHVGNDLNAPLETDPQQLYGARRQISFMLSKEGRLQNPAYGSDDVMRALISTRDVLDRQILDGAPGFQRFLDNYRAASPEIDRQTFLQKYHLSDAGKMTLTNVNQVLKDIRRGMTGRGASPADAFTDEDLYGRGGLFALRRDLQRQSNRNLTAPAGSPTSYNLDLGAQLGINAATNALSHVAGNVPVVGPLISGGTAMAAGRNARLMKERYINELLQRGRTTPPP